MITLTDEYLIECKLCEIAVPVPYTNYQSIEEEHYIFNRLYITPHNFDKLVEHRYLLQCVETSLKDSYILHNCYVKISGTNRKILIFNIDKKMEPYSVFWTTTKYGIEV